MSEPFVGEIRQFPYSFAPHNFAYCAGQLMPIQQNTALYSILGVNYGGNGTSNFGLPNLQGRALMHTGQGAGLTPRTIGETAGNTAVTLTSLQIPAHSHLMTVKIAGAKNVIDAGTNNYLSQSMVALSQPQKAYSNSTNNLVPLDSAMISPAGGGQAGASQPHENRQPYLVMSFCIALFGMFPSRN